jgi:flagellar biosynthesis protein FliR
MTHALHIALPQFQSLLVILIRIGGIVAAMPILGSRSIPPQIKIGFLLAFALALLPVVHVTPLPEDPLRMAVGLGAEFLVGLVIGLGLRILFAGIELAGDMMSVQMGLGVVQLLDPATSQQMPLLSNMQSILASMIFLSLNAHFIVVQAVASSFDLVAPFGAGVTADLVQDVIRLTQGIFLIALKLAAPVMVTILLINLAMAVMGRTVAQMNVFLLSQPVTIIAGFLVIGAALPFTLSLYEAEFIRLGDLLQGLLRMLGHG